MSSALRENVHTEVWGRHAWMFLHAVAASYPEDPTPEDRRKARAFYSSLQWALPCSHCRQEYAEMLRSMPVATRSKKDLESWIWQCHNSVNRRLGKTSSAPDLQTVQRNMRAAPSQSPKWVAMGLAVVAAVICGIWQRQQRRSQQSVGIVTP